MKNWFLLFGGSSPDGRGEPKFIERTTNKRKAKSHYKKCEKDPYSTGQVMIVTDGELEIANCDTSWDA